MHWTALPTFLLARQSLAVADAAGLPRQVALSFLPLLQRMDQIGPNFFSFARDDPGYLTDLRLKRTSEPQQLWEWSLRLILTRENAWDVVQGLPVQDAAVARLVGAPGPQPAAMRDLSELVEGHRPHQDDVITQVLCCYVNYAGSWDDAALIARTVLRTAEDLPQSDSAARLLSLSACALGVAGCRDEARALFQYALTRWEHPLEVFMTLLRWATAELKRFGDAQRSASVRGQAMVSASVLARDGSDADVAIARALVCNLTALSHLKSSDFHQAEAALREALQFGAASAATVMFPRDVAERYRLMLVTNLGLLRLATRDWDGAVATFAEITLNARAIGDDVLGEALSLWGYALMRAGQSNAAYPRLLEAEEFLRKDFSLPRLRRVRQLLAVAADRQGRQVEARMWLQLGNRLFTLPN